MLRIYAVGTENDRLRPAPAFYWLLPLAAAMAFSPPSGSAAGPEEPSRRSTVSAAIQPFAKDQSYRAIVFVFLSAECPLAQKYSGVIESLHRQYQDRQIGIFGVFAGRLAQDPDAATFAEDYDLSFPILNDPELELTRELNARITPEVVVLDARFQIAYRGKIDNWFYQLGRRRTQATEHYLRDALESLLSGERPRVARTEPLGCFIADLPP